MTAQLREFESLLNAGGHSAADLKPSLVRLSNHLRERLTHADFSSVPYVKEAVRLIARVKGNAFGDLRSSMLSEVVPYLYAHGSMTEALIGADALRRAAMSQKEIRRAENYLGIVHAALGNIAEAVTRYHNSLVIAREIGDQVGEVSVLTNLAAALTNGGLYREALPCLALAEKLCEGNDKLRVRDLSNILTNTALTLHHLGESDGACRLMSRCRGLQIDIHDAESVLIGALRELNFVEICMGAGRLGEARQHAKACAEYGTRSPEGLASVPMLLATGLVDVCGGDAEHGLHSIEIACEKASAAQHMSIRDDALRIRIVAYKHCDRPREALQAVRELLTHLTITRQAAVHALLSLHDLHRPLNTSGDLLTLKLAEAELRAASAELDSADSFFEMLERLAITGSLKEDPSGEHGYRVGRLAALLAEEIGWPKDRSYMVEVSGRLHDIGKVGIPDRILLGREDLKEAERHFMRSHTIIGAELLARSDMPQMKIAEEVARCHHEWWDGSGYLANLVGDQIPISARMVALADVFDALTHGRPYAAAWSLDEALLHIERLSGKQFDPDLTPRFIGLVRALSARHRDLDTLLGRAAHESAFLTARRKLKSMLESERQQLDARSI